MRISEDRGRRPARASGGVPGLVWRAPALGAILLFAAASSATAGEGVFYAGYAASAERFDATFDKSVDNTDPNTLVPEPRRGMIFRDRDSADGIDLGVGFVGGYRAPLGAGGAYLSTELDATVHSGDADGQLAGVGTSADRKQLGESWPDSWSVRKKRSYGLTLRLGFAPGALGKRDMTLYLLGGVRRVEARFVSNYNGCFTAEPCASPSEYGSGTDSRDADALAATWGIGVEKRFGKDDYLRRFALRMEAQFSRYGEKKWVDDFPDIGVTVPSALEADGVGLTVSLVRLFGGMD